jgi:hypothetical protein
MKSIFVFCALLVTTSAFFIDTKGNDTSSEEIEKQQIAAFVEKFRPQIDCIKTQFAERQEQIIVRTVFSLNLN